MTTTRLIMLALAAWRLAHLLVLERGPFGVFASLREQAQGTEAGKALDCLWCTSIWTALFVVVLERVWRLPVIALAVAGAALIADRVVNSE